ncbi:hypothetical protein HID58_091744 [Brassica napus]|uniref:Uncharacterized protein n=1 Tax=Brassica napus TaxID=3708 RepID=A0ABQ7X0A2_BRANA|nr:hypothetical protein HID58_091744 [Brassica napus]
MDFRRWDPGSEGKVWNRADLSHDNKIWMIWFRYRISAKRARRDLRRDIRYRGNMGFERIPLWRSLDWTWNQEDQSQDYRKSVVGDMVLMGFKFGVRGQAYGIAIKGDVN